MTNTENIITDKSRQTAHWIEAGRRDRERCATQDDLNWYGALASERLHDADATVSERAWFSGYLHALYGGE